jgi:hypothetical protein|tara:strand:- start:131 stop:559 length:429 start_codon:yes stop_codon:yes gene_type:complete
MAILQGAAYWASVTTPNTTFEPVYSVNLVVDDATAEDFQSRGFTIKQMDEGPAIVIKRKVNGPNGMIRQAPRLVDSQKNQLDARVGNGSNVRVQYKEWSSEWKGTTFKGLDFQAMQVIDLVEVGSPDGSEFDAMDSGMEDEL